MVNGMIGKKLGMSMVFDGDGKAVTVTLLAVGPCKVLQVKSKEKEGYDAVQLGFAEIPEKRQVIKPLAGHFKKSDSHGYRVVKEFKVTQANKYSPGDVIDVNLFKKDDLIKVSGKSKGKGFQGVMKRHGMRGGPATHGSMFHREPGSIGSSAYPSRTLKGLRAPGHMGNKMISVKNIKVFDVDTEKNVLVVKGAVPGPNGNYLYITLA